MVRVVVGGAGLLYADGRPALETFRERGQQLYDDGAALPPGIASFHAGGFHGRELGLTVVWADEEKDGIRRAVFTPGVGVFGRDFAVAASDDRHALLKNLIPACQNGCRSNSLVSNPTKMR